MGTIVFVVVAILGFWALVKLTGGSSDTAAGLPPTGDGLPAGTTAVLRLPGGAKMEMVWCPPGSFMMGSPEDEEGHRDSEPLHSVTVAEGFWMAKYAVTQKQWQSVMGGNPSHFKGDGLPVEHVSWFDCMKFCRKAGLALPSEAQWEYACRAGSTGAYGGTGNLNEMGWHDGNTKPWTTHSVGEKAPNAWGLYDMHGNVWEWCNDVWRYEPAGVSFDPETAGPDDDCVIRGGSIGAWPDEDCRSAFRRREEPHFNDEPFGAPMCFIGFRPIARPK